MTNIFVTVPPTPVVWWRAEARPGLQWRPRRVRVAVNWRVTVLRDASRRAEVADGHVGRVVVVRRHGWMRSRYRPAVAGRRRGWRVRNVLPAGVSG